ncbi:MAG: hypothetical protein PHT69_07435 [Bacteroidales bacterium]|nr:hypothetical protein [Bacteroidales bacterium]
MILLRSLMYMIVLALLMCSTSQGQDVVRKKEKSAFGFQIKPIIPSGVFRIVTSEILQDNVLFKVEPQTGYSLGATIRFGISRRFAVQTDINYIKRNFTFSVTDSSFYSEIDLRIVSYEIPILATHFVRLSQNLYMGQTLGLSFQFLPTNLYSKNEYINQLSLKRWFMSTSFVANVGFEWRTENSGYFYIGPTYHMYFNHMFNTKIEYKNALQETKTAYTKLEGNYFGIIGRYVFN